MQWKLLTVKMPVSQVAYSSDITKHNLCPHLIMILFISIYCKWHAFLEAADTCCRGNYEYLHTKWMSIQCIENVYLPNVRRLLNFFFFFFFFYSLYILHCGFLYLQSFLLPTFATYLSRCRVIPHSVKGLSDMKHCNKGCQCFSTCTNVPCKYKPQSDVKYLQHSKSKRRKGDVLCGQTFLKYIIS